MSNWKDEERAGYCRVRLKFMVSLDSYPLCLLLPLYVGSIAMAASFEMCVSSDREGELKSSLAHQADFENLW